MKIILNSIEEAILDRAQVLALGVPLAEGNSLLIRRGLGDQPLRVGPEGRKGGGRGVKVVMGARDPARACQVSLMGVHITGFSCLWEMRGARPKARLGVKAGKGFQRQERQFADQQKRASRCEVANVPRT